MLMPNVGSMLVVFGLFYSAVWRSSASGGPAITINVPSGVTVHINRTEASQSQCNVCVGKSCQSSVTLRSSMEVVFTCPKPEDSFMVEIVRHIACATSCNGTIVPEEVPSLLTFNRTLTWTVVVLGHRAFSLDFTRVGLRQIQPTETCQDKHVFTVKAATATVGMFCRQGTIRSMHVLRNGSVTVQVPGRQQLDVTKFGVSLGPQIKSLALLNVTLPEVESAQEFLSPNFPYSFPDDDVVSWTFNVPAKFYTTVQLVTFTEPECWKKDTRLEYQLNGKILVKNLKDAQLSEHQGSFNLSLYNCEKKDNSVLSLWLKVSSMRRGREVRCTVDLGKEKRMEIHLKKTKPRSACILKLNSLVQETVTILSARTSFLSFIDCQEEDLVITVNKTIACVHQSDCLISRVPLFIPALEKCLVGVLQQVTWYLYGPQDGAVELVSVAGGLQQSLPGQACNSSSVLFSVSENEPQGITLGRFCPQGAIHKMQINVNSVKVSATPVSSKDLRQITEPFLNASFGEDIKESYIFTILPKKDVPVLLATPAWPAGMRPHSTVSWFVSFPSQLEARLGFINVSKVTCKNWHASIKVQMQHSQDKMYSWQDQNPKDMVVPENFFLNMSNCMPVKGSFSVVSKITVEAQKSVFVSIILSVVATVLLLVGMVLAVVCIKMRKKQTEKPSDVSVYNPNPHSILPGFHGFPITAKEDEDPVYHYIDDTMVYTHLLKDSVEMKGFGEPAVGVYQGFTGPTENQPLTRQEEPELGTYRPFTGPQSVPDLLDQFPKQEGSLASKAKQIEDVEINGENSDQDQAQTMPDIQQDPKSEPDMQN